MKSIRMKWIDVCHLRIYRDIPVVLAQVPPSPGHGQVSQPGYGYNKEIGSRRASGQSLSTGGQWQAEFQQDSEGQVGPGPSNTTAAAQDIINFSRRLDALC